MTALFCKTLVNVTVLRGISSSSKFIQCFMQGLRVKIFGKVVKCKISQNTIS